MSTDPTATTRNPDPSERAVAVVTGASSGIGAATARHLAAAGFHVVLGARRVERLRELAAEIDATAARLDVTDADSVAEFVAQLPQRCRVLVNNAGGAKGSSPVAEADEHEWRWMWETNVLGTLRLTKELLPRLVASGDGHVITVTSVAALEVYDNGAGYTSAKHAEAALHRTLRGEHLGEPVRFTEVAPGLVETEFSEVRYGGDTERAAAVYRGLTPLSADDVADVIAYAATRPAHVNLDQIVLKPRDQASATRAHRR
ncbi:SDR family NAD(P)-dependent oxidoreductase [Actinopolyspora mortivallis]|uniref:SDR family NAD(P)-dependent oxidoreductase n=1 Tax=Actinopolyspora mortivallis TaxID=33906 RepID=UPI00036A0F16|nr:SDR family NAD(P)-dependent oxidoreductase [Actinopolyspora mortivallis]